MKKIILIFTLILFTFFSYSQDSKGYLGIGIGLSIPGGEDVKDVGYKSGLSLNLLNAGYLFSDSFGLTLNWGGTASSSKNDCDDCTYALGYFSIGPLIRVSAGESMTIDFKPQIATTSAQFENLLVSGDKWTASTTGFVFGTSLNFGKEKGLGFSLNADYVASGKINEYDLNNGNIVVVSSPSKVSAFTVGAGIMYRF
tara:strand:+ start:1181 stop:1774 length:594 start_codon:yes stop_codon:yes gene_type:complete